MFKVKEVRAGWWNAFRPWTLHGAVVPVLIGGAAAYACRGFDAASWILFVMILASGCLLQSAANLLNTYGDFAKGTDTVENETRSPELVTGKLRPKDVMLAGLGCMGIVCLFGLVFIHHAGWGVAVFGLLGLAGAGLYTTGISYKYHGLGQPSVFFMMGILMPLGTYYVLTGRLSSDVFLMSLPNAFLITAVLCGNETRDYHEDKAAGVPTLCGHLSYGGAMKLYLAEIVLAYPILLAVIAVGAAPWECALAFLTLYDLLGVYRNSKKAPEDPHASFMLVPSAFRLNWHFGTLLVLGYIIGVCIIPVI